MLRCQDHRGGWDFSKSPVAAGSQLLCAHLQGQSCSWGGRGASWQHWGASCPSLPIFAGAVRGKRLGEVRFGLSCDILEPWGCPQGSGGRCCRSHCLWPASPGAVVSTGDTPAPVEGGCLGTWSPAFPGVLTLPTKLSHRVCSSLSRASSPFPQLPRRGWCWPHTEPTTQGSRLIPILSFP